MKIFLFIIFSSPETTELFKKKLNQSVSWMILDHIFVFVKHNSVMALNPHSHNIVT